MKTILKGENLEYGCAECGALKHWPLEDRDETAVREQAEREIAEHNKEHGI